jgi:hypothetical protein
LDFQKAHEGRIVLPEEENISDLVFIVDPKRKTEVTAQVSVVQVHKHLNHDEVEQVRIR